MKLTIFGATGATGTSLARQALAAGHEVTAVVRDPARLPIPARQRLRILTADVMNPAAISPAIPENSQPRQRPPTPPHDIIPWAGTDLYTMPGPVAP